MTASGGRWRRIGATAVALVAAAAAAVAAPPPRSMAVAASAGIFNVDADRSPRAATAGLELRRSAARWGLAWVAGLAVTEERSAWGYGGLARPFDVGRGWQLTPGFAAALYDRGDGKELGGAVQFRSSLEATVPVGDRYRLGLSLYHLSNAGLDEVNPGSNGAVVVVTVALD